VTSPVGGTPRDGYTNACVGVDLGRDMTNSRITLAIDGYGGDHAPDSVVAGLARAAAAVPAADFVLCGGSEALKALLAPHAALAERVRLVEAPDRIAGDTKPSQAVRNGRRSSMWAAIEAVERGEAAAVVSAGNTGALMGMALLRLRPMTGVSRPAIAATWPTMKRPATVLDVGANVEADADQLVEFAIMGEAFHRAMHGIARPGVALLNIGSEELKGHDSIRRAAQILRDPALGLDFRGYVEGDGISAGEADVVVCDGFTGNVALKTAEGTARLVGSFVREALTSGPASRLGALLASGGLRQLKARMDPRSVNGGVFLGLNGLVVKSHGGTDAVGFATAVELAARLAASDFRTAVSDKMKWFGERRADERARAAQVL